MAIEQQFAMLAPHERSILWQHATLPEHEQLRDWLDEQLRRLDAGAAPEFFSRLRDSRLHTQALAELAAGYVLQQPGSSIEFGARFGQLTLDIVVTHPDGRRLIVEVWRRGLSQVTASRNSGWVELARQIRRIPIPFEIALGAGDFVIEPPKVSARRNIERGLRAWLGAHGAPATPGIEVEGLTFRVVGATATGHAEMLPVRDGVAADRSDVIDAIERKVSRYRRLAEDVDLPFLVVLSADSHTALDATFVDKILAGQNSLSIAIPIYGVGAVSSGRIKLRQTDAMPTFDPALSGVAWLETNDGLHAMLNPFWPNPTSTRPVQVTPPSALITGEASDT